MQKIGLVIILKPKNSCQQNKKKELLSSNHLGVIHLFMIFFIFLRHREGKETRRAIMIAYIW